jgi:sugar/nucleoside kinase (ribokinase family)
VTPVVITGYASLDYVVRLDRAPVPDATATILSRPLDWPRLGGSPAYVASAMVAAGVDAMPISWVADDADGCAYCDALVNRGVSDEGIAVSPGRTPICVLAYQPDGGCHCFYHPSLAEPLMLDAHQLELVAEAQWVCLTVGPPGATRQALAAIRPGAKLVWAVKADPRAVPAELAAAICARADIVAASRAEAAFVAAALAAAGPSRRRRLLVETRGAEGVAVTQDGRVEWFPAAAVEAEDTTGAGDTFLGGFLASLIIGNEAPERAVGAGARAARQLLVARGLVKKGC